MKRIYITFGGEAYDHITERVTHHVFNFGVDELRVYDDAWLMQQPFYRENQWLWTWREAWGFGWNCWKALIIKHAFYRHSGEDVAVLYVDADTYPIEDLTLIFDFAERDGVCLFESQGNLNKRFTRRDVFRAMGCDEQRYWDARHACGRFSAWRIHGPIGRVVWDALQAWDRYLVDARCQGWHASEHGGDFPEFHRNSGDQSILTVLAEKYQFPLHREACQFGWPPSPGHGQPDDRYPQLFVQDGSRARDDLRGSRFAGVWHQSQSGQFGVRDGELWMPEREGSRDPLRDYRA